MSYWLVGGGDYGVLGVPLKKNQKGTLKKNFKKKKHSAPPQSPTADNVHVHILCSYVQQNQQWTLFYLWSNRKSEQRNVTRVWKRAVLANKRPNRSGSYRPVHAADNENGCRRRHGSCALCIHICNNTYKTKYRFKCHPIACIATRSPRSSFSFRRDPMKKKKKEKTYISYSGKSKTAVNSRSIIMLGRELWQTIRDFGSFSVSFFYWISDTIVRECEA